MLPGLYGGQGQIAPSESSAAKENRGLIRRTARPRTIAKKRFARICAHYAKGTLKGAFTWRSLNGQNAYEYWVLNAPAYTVRLRPATRVLTNADVLQLIKSGLGVGLIVEKIQTFDPADIAALHNGGVSDAIIASMMRALEQGGPTTGIQPVKPPLWPISLLDAWIGVRHDGN
jgi:hypothetical protein